MIGPIPMPPPEYIKSADDAPLTEEQLRDLVFEQTFGEIFGESRDSTALGKGVE